MPARPLPLFAIAVIVFDCGMSNAGERIEVRATVSKATVLIGEPVHVKVTILNRSDKAALTGPIVQSRGAGLLIDLTPPGGQRRSVTNPSGNLESQGKEVRLEGGDTWCFEQRIGHSDRDRRTFLELPTPGEHVLHVRYPDSFRVEGQDKTIDAPEARLEVTVASPRGVDAEIWRMLWRDDVVSVLTYRPVQKTCDKSIDAS